MLKARKKITKREIKEDPLVTFYVRTQKFLQKHSKQFNIGLLVVVVIATFIVLDTRSKRAGNKRAESSIVTAEQIYFSRNFDRAITELQAVIQANPGTVSAGRSVFYMANCYYEKGEYADAMQFYQQYLNDYGSIDYFKISSQSGIGACLENEGRFEEAAGAYEEAASMAEKSFTRPFDLQNAARCYAQAGMHEKGRTIYQQILAEYPDVPFSSEVNFQLNAL
jgi:tetratricopeptide (TPR) repeat protein